MNQAEATGHGRPDRLAELVVHLTDCDPQQALQLVSPGDVADRPGGAAVDKLEVVARAIVRLRRARSGIAQPQPARSIDLREQPVGLEEMSQ